MDPRPRPVRAAPPPPRRGGPPFFPMRRLPPAPLALVGIAAILLAACGGTGPPLPAPPPPGATPSAGALRDALADMARADRDSLLARRLYVYGLTPAFEGRFRLASGPVVAFVPGRHPVRGRELVVAAAEVGTPGAAALLEEARLLSASAAFTVAPERTVLVAFLPPGAGARGLAAVLDAPVWTRPLTVAALVVGSRTGAEAFEAVGAARGVPVQVVAAPAPGQEPVAEALALAAAFRTALAAAADGAPASPDVREAQSSASD